ncbi:host specificity protein J [Haemophilus parainfluenzae]|uniref:host specificity protein J n=1 Tax=Haemophilus parainfluenzae TaxID=729 RepID=UPI000DAC3AB3|nr:phage tail protein [Haemophilus parainfluenzae]RDE81441.1 host specificity protein J [Haemophilus parainfluenzae]
MGKGGGGGHTPVEAKETGRSKQLVKIVEVISEGEVEGLADGMKSVYFDNTPVQNKDGSYNFNNVQLEGRVGSQVQDVIAGFNTSEKEVSVGTQVRKNLPITRTVTDSKVSRLRLTIGVQSIFSQAENGDTNGTTVELVITIGSQSYPVSISGKYSAQYLQQHTFDNLPPVPFTVKVERVTEDSKSQRLQNNTVWSSYTEIIDTEFTYPNTALIGVKFDSEYFSNIPARTYDLLGLRVKVPSNYDTRTRKYTGMWDGTFKTDWTDNPAWILYDVVTSKRYGLGNRLGDFGADKWALYQVSQYCDQLVPDGFGGQEPRFTCNAWLTEQRSAYDVINDICSIFRAVPVWNGQQLTVVMDRPSDPVWTYTNANVSKDGFSYTFSAKKVRHNAIQVEYADKDNGYEKAIEYVSDDESIRRNGLNVKKITAFGCTSRGQAHRTGLWLLQTEKLETKTVSFVVGAEGLMHVPGDIIKVADTYYAGTNVGGRVLAVNGKKVTLDREISVNGNSYFSYINAQAKHQDIKIVSVNGAEVTLDQEPAGLEAYGVWSLSTQQVTSQLFKALSVKEETKGKYTITALQHEPQKEAIVDDGAKFEPKETTIRNLSKVNGSNVNYGDDGINLTWDVLSSPNEIFTYEVKLYRGGALFRTYLDLKEPKLSLDNLPNGSYTAEIRARNQRGQLSDPVTRSFEINLNIPRFVTKSLLFAIELDWDLPKTATVGNYTEVWRSATNDISKAVKVATLPYPQNNYVMSGVPLSAEYYFWLRCGDKNDNKGEFTAAVFGEADHNPDNLLNAIEGKITKSHLGQELINSIKADINNAVGEEAKTRQTAVAGALAQISAQAQSSGTAIKNLEKADQAQIETIKTVTAKAESALSGITAVRQAQAESDKANAQQINALTAKVGNAESTVSQVSSAVAGLNGKVSSMHTIKTQAIAGGRTAVAGIALGANQEESSVIVMADKFGIVANANDGNVKPVFSVANGQVGIRGDLVVAGSVTRDKLSSGGGGNILDNPIFANNAYGWGENRGNGALARQTTSLVRRMSSKFSGLVTNSSVMIAEVRANSAVSSWWQVATQTVSVAPGRRYCLSAFIDAWACTGELMVQEVGSDGKTWVRDFAFSGRKGRGISGYSQFGKMEEGSGSIEPSTRSHVFFTAPSSGYVSVTCIMRDIQLASVLKIANPMLEECTEHATEPSPWANAGVSAIHGGSIIADTIRGDHILANQEIRAPRITGGVITGNTVNGATVNGGTVNGAVVSGGTVKGAIVEGGVIKGARLEAVTGKFSGTLEVNNLVGGNLCEVFVANIDMRTFGSKNDEVTFYTAAIHINPSPVKRIVFIVNSDVSFIVNANERKEYYYSKTSRGNHPPEIFNIGKGNPKICFTAYAVSDARTIYQ